MVNITVCQLVIRPIAWNENFSIFETLSLNFFPFSIEIISYFVQRLKNVFPYNPQNRYFGTCLQNREYLSRHLASRTSNIFIGQFFHFLFFIMYKFE